MISGAPVERGFDVFKTNGGAMKAVVPAYPMQVDNGKAALEFNPVIGKFSRPPASSSIPSLRRSYS